MMAVFYFEGEEQRGDQPREIARTSALLTARVSEAIAFYAQALDAYAKNQRLVDAMAREDWGAIHEQERMLSGILPLALKVRFIPLSALGAEDKTPPPLGFASQEMIQRAQQGGQLVPAEVHQFYNEYRHIALAAPVREPDRGAVVGVAHLALSFQLLEKIIGDVSDVPGHIELQQVVDGVALTLVGSGVSHSGVAEGQLPVSGTIWQVAYGSAVEREEGGLLLPAILVAGGVFILLIVASVYMRLKRMLAADISSLENLLGSEARLRGGRPPRAALTDLEPLFLRLTKCKPAPVTAESEAVKQNIEKPEVGKATSEALAPVEVDAEEKAQSMGLTMDLYGQVSKETMIGDLPGNIFRAYDVGGIVGEELTRDLAYELGRAIGSEAYARGQQRVVVGRDGRDSGDLLINALCKGLVDSGRDVVRIGMAPTPVLYFATHFLGGNTGVMVTGSHKTPEYNGLKIVIDGEALAGDAIQALRRRIEEGDLQQGSGLVREQVVSSDYIARVVDDVQLARPMKVVVDAGNGAAGVVAPDLLRELGCEVIELFCEVDGRAPGRGADPSRPENLQALIASVQEQRADLGLAFDSDGDCLGVVDSNGKIIWPDRLLMLFARDVLVRQPGADIIFDVKSSRHLPAEILASGGRPLMVKTGHAWIKAKMQESGAPLAGEMSGHIFFNDRWYGFEDALYAAARLLEILASEMASTAEIFARLPESVSTQEINMPVGDVDAAALLHRVAQEPFPDAKLVTVDGLRFEFSDGWGLMRLSNTTPTISFRFEADSSAALERIQALFRERLKSIAPALSPPF